MILQVVSRNNDVNGNPYRLIMTYNNEGVMEEVYEARSSSPDIVNQLLNKGYNQIRTFHLAPKEYNELKKDLVKWKGHKIILSY